MVSVEITPIDESKTPMDESEWIQLLSGVFLHVLIVESKLLLNSQYSVL